jgi:hypothetical protein
MNYMKNPTILFLTAGLGGKSFEEAADRLIVQASSFGFFTHLHAIKEEEIFQICPRILDWYKKDDLPGVKGFGWYTWKATIAHQAIVAKRWGNFDLVMYLDAGCEMFNSKQSARRLRKYIDFAMEQGRTLFSIPTPEREYTKRDLFEYFPSLSPEDATPQFQSGSWILKIDSNQHFAEQWEILSSIGVFMTDESLSQISESDDFKVHRYDQSIFSLLAKSLGFKSVLDVPPGAASSVRAKLRGFFHPFWWTRNRTGVSMIPRFMITAGKISNVF